MTREPHWIDKEALLLLHAESLAEHGGLEGLRDEGLLDSALARPMNLFAYHENVELSDLAAAYAFGIARNHPFVDGNKRAAFLSIGLFLSLNGKQLVADQVDAIQTMIAVAAGEYSENELAKWLKQRMKRRARR
jgi:death-on-curing protein